MSGTQSLRFKVLTAVVLAFVLSAVGCSNASGEVKVSLGDNGSKVHIEAGEILVVTLGSNPTTGYIWEIDEIEEHILIQIGEVEFVPKSEDPIPGQGGAEVFRFEALASGDTRLKLIYHRPWEEGVEPVDEFTIDLTVK